MAECSEFGLKSNTWIALRIAYSITTKAEAIIVLCFVSQNFKAEAQCVRGMSTGVEVGGQTWPMRAGQTILAHFAENQRYKPFISHHQHRRQSKNDIRGR